MGKTRDAQESLVKTLKGRNHLEDGGKNGMILTIINILGLGWAESHTLKRLMGLLYTQTWIVKNDHRISGIRSDMNNRTTHRKN
jgi:hypothetical protein